MKSYHFFLICKRFEKGRKKKTHTAFNDKNLIKVGLNLITDCFIKPFKGALSGLRRFLATENSLKMMKNAFLFHPKNSFRSEDI